MKYLDKLPQPDRAWAALIWVILAFFVLPIISKGVFNASSNGDYPLMYLLGMIAILFAYQLQRIAAYILKIIQVFIAYTRN